MKSLPTRRDLLTHAASAGAAVVASSFRADASALRASFGKAPPHELFPISLNTATLRGHKLPLPEVIDIAAKAGYQGIEPWSDEIDRYLQSGGALRDLRARLKDRGLAVTGAIAFFQWMVDDETRRAAGFEEARRRMAQIREIGGRHIAAPPAGDVQGVDLLRAAPRYRELLDLGAQFDVVPALEIWGFASNLYRVGQAALVALEAHHPNACILPDVYHLYKGGSWFGSIRQLSPNLLAGFHLNDYPADPPRETITDKNRLCPGDGIAPLKTLIRDLRVIGYRGPVSVELFNPEHARQDPVAVARTAMEKTRAVILEAPAA
jgi:2-keto-myo-inositol isomerase